MPKPAAWRTGQIHDWHPRTLRQKQTLFLACIAKLINYAHGNGWELTGSDFAVDEDRIAKGLRESLDGRGTGTSIISHNELRALVGHRLSGCHSMKIAGDLNLFLKGKIKTKHCPEWQHLGKLWKDIHRLCRWGGDFASQDYNHFSITHGGRS